MTDKWKELAADSLLQANITTRRELEAWIEAQKHSMMVEKRSHALKMDETKHQVAEAERRQQQCEQQQRTLVQQCHEHEEQISAQQVEIEVLQVEKNRKDPAFHELLGKKQAQEDRLKELLQDANTNRSTQEQQLRELQQGLAMYEKLGLHFDQTGEDRMVVRFTQLDARDPARSFRFRIRLDAETDKYLVDECDPPIPTLSTWVHLLNQTGDLSFFIRAMRRQFKQLV